MAQAADQQGRDLAGRDLAGRDPHGSGRAAAELVAAARGGNRRAVGRLLSLAERAAADPHGAGAAALGRALGPVPAAGPDAGPNAVADARPSAAAAGGPRVVGITGPPGAGKSTLVGALVTALRRRDRTVWVLAVDPSSPVTGGALLGDRLRMADAGDPGVVVRSLASRGASGGLAAAVPWAVRVAAALGADDVLVETVGSGQADVAVAAMVEITVLAVPPGLGDEVQALKAGIVELADVICVTKGDRPDAATAARQWRGALGRGPDAPPVVVVAALAGDVAALVDVLDDPAVGSARHAGDPPWASFGIASRAAARVTPEVTAGIDRALGDARRAATAGRVAETLVHLGDALRLGHRPGEPDPLGLPDLRGLAEPGGLTGLVERASARLAPSEVDPSEVDDVQR